MPRGQVWIVLLVGAVWLLASYYVRYALIEDARWVEVCSLQSTLWSCQLRSQLGLLIHFKVLAWLALALVLPSFIVPARVGRYLALLALLFAIPALVLYTTSLAAITLVLAALYLVRERSLAV